MVTRYSIECYDELYALKYLQARIGHTITDEEYEKATLVYLLFSQGLDENKSVLPLEENVFLLESRLFDWANYHYDYINHRGHIMRYGCLDPRFPVPRRHKDKRRVVKNSKKFAKVAKEIWIPLAHRRHDLFVEMHICRKYKNREIDVGTIQHAKEVLEDSMKDKEFHMGMSLKIPNYIHV